MRQQGRTKGAKANNLHHMQRENIHTVRTRCPEEPSQRGDTLHIHELYPAFSPRPPRCLSMFILYDDFAPLSHHFQLSFSLHHPLDSLLHPLLLPFLPRSRPKRTPCASIACVMDSWERASIDLSSEEAGAERKHREKLQEALQTCTRD